MPDVTVGKQTHKNERRKKKKIEMVMWETDADSHSCRNNATHLID